MSKKTKRIRIVLIIATLAVLSVVIYFTMMRMNQNKHNNVIHIKSDHELAVQLAMDAFDTKDQKFEGTELDLYGQGERSFVFSNGSEFGTGDDTNSLIIVDRVKNTSSGSNDKVKISYQCNLRDGENVLGLEVDLLRDITGGKQKEIVVRYDVHGSTYGAYYPAIFGYSEKESAYTLLGTYPEAGKIESKDMSKVLSREIHADKTSGANCYDGEQSYYLSEGSSYSWHYWVNSEKDKELLVERQQYDSDENILINSYKPLYNEEKNLIEWKPVLSEYYPEKKEFTEEELVKFLEDKLSTDIDLLAER